METERPLSRSLLRLVLITAGVLAIPLVVTQFTEGEGWSLFDYGLVAGLVLGAGLAYEVAVRTATSLVSAAVTALVAALGGAAMVVGEVDDAPGLILLGMVFVGVAVVAGVKAARGRPSAT